MSQKLGVFYDAINGFLISQKMNRNKWFLVLQKIGF